MRNLVLALCGATALLAPAAAHAQSNLFSCDKSGNRQGSGAVVGGIIGGVLGNQLASDKDQTLGTVLGLALGAAVGSNVGCNMSNDDTSRADVATRTALDQNRAQTWSSSRTGMSGRVDIVNTYYQDDVAARAPDYNYNSGSARSLDQVRFARGVQRPGRYSLMDTRYRADQTVNIRSGPSTRSTVLDRLNSGDRFEALARVNTGWLLVARNGVAVGYVSERIVQAQSYDNNSRYSDNNNDYDNRYDRNDRNGTSDGYQRAADRMTCRTFDQTVQSGGANGRSTQRFSACQNLAGQWVIQG